MKTDILLAQKLYESGEKIAAGEKCLSLLNNVDTAADAYLLLSQICFDKKEYKQSLQYLNESKVKNLATTAHEYLVGLNHYALKDLSNAKLAFENILKTNPGDTESLRNLGVISKKEGSAFEAAAYFCDALDIDSTETLIRKNLFDALEAVSAEEQGIARLSYRVRPHLETALASPDFDLNRYLRVVTALIFSADHILLANQKLQFFAPEEPIDLDADAWFVEVCRDVLLQRLMTSNIIALAEIEHFLTQLRRCLLEIISNCIGLLTHIPLEFCIAMAQQAFLTEYVYEVSEAEIKLIQEFRDALVAKISSGKPLEAADQKIVALISAYMSMDEWLQEGSLVSEEGALGALVKSQIQDRRDEGELRHQIKANSKITDKTSIKVMNQYEESPFPRWSSLPQSPESTIGNMLEALFSDYKPPAKLYEECSILIAGCGTGQHPIREALRYPECQVTAVDLSLRSLATAMRRSKEFGVSNIEFLQADILNLKNYPDQFDFISCSGVLHHMADPLAGWRVLLAKLSPGGVMKIALYSKIARRHIAEVREWISELGRAPTKKNISEIRQLIFNLPRDDTRRRVLEFSDFYSTSSARDLLFHVEEHTFSLEQVSNAIDDLGLEFIGLQLPNSGTEQKFKKLFPKDRDMQDLLKWQEFERVYPDSFRSMYHFWCGKS